MRRLATILTVVMSTGVALLFLAQSSGAATPSSIVISEVQTGSQTDASQEFVEFYNPSVTDTSLSGWALQYKSATGTSWTKKVALSGTIASHGFYLLSSTGYLSTADGTFASGLSGTAGHVRLVDSTGTIIDTVGWGKTADSPETSPAPAPGPGQSIERAPGWLIEDGGNASDTNDNSVDFLVRQVAAPQSTKSSTEEPQPRPDATPAPSDSDAPAAPVVYPDLQITELLPDPAMPQTDASDEFIELYNPNSDPVDVQGYVLKTGSNFHSAYILPDRTIEPDSYLVIYSAVSHLGLVNSGGAVELFDPAGTLIDETPNYGAAKTGDAFALDGDTWDWTLQPTPGAENIMVADTTLKATPKPKVAKVTKPKAVKKVAVKKPKKAKKAKASTSSEAPVALATPDNSSSRWLLLGLAGLTLGYIGFEFRYDLRNLYHLIRRDR